jgi:DNA-binding CsgD family transcriptional regulator
MLHGYGQKILAMDLGVACSTIASTGKQALACMGFDCLPSRVPLALVVVAQASEDEARSQFGSVCAFTHGERLHFILAIPRPDRDLARLLPPAEVEVMRARIEGQSHQLIARVRRTSERTIANQLASASRRLGVSGRLEIIGHLTQKAPVIPLN